MNNLELFPVANYIDPNRVDLNTRNNQRNRQSEYEQITKDLVAQWEQMALDTNDVLLEMKLGEIKKILTYCTKQQKDNFGLRLTEWIWFNNDVSEIYDGYSD